MTITISPKAGADNAINKTLVQVGRIFSGEVADDGTLLINYLLGGIRLSDGLKERIACDFLGCSTEELAALRLHTPEAPTPFDEAIKKLGAPDEADGHWSLDEGNLRWFVSQCQQVKAQATPESLEEALHLIKDFPYEGDYDGLMLSVETIRTHIAAQQSEVARLRAETEYYKQEYADENKARIKAEQDCFRRGQEIERLREALRNCDYHADILKTVTHNTGYSREEIAIAIHKCIKAGEDASKALNPEQKGE
jgi:hypothetical protein